MTNIRIAAFRPCCFPGEFLPAQRTNRSNSPACSKAPGWLIPIVRVQVVLACILRASGLLMMSGDGALPQIRVTICSLMIPDQFCGMIFR